MIDVAVDGPVATVSVAGLPRLTRHDVAFGRELCAVLRGFDDNDVIKAIVLTSPEDDFCAASQGEPGAPEAWLSTFAAASGLYQTWMFSRKVTLAAVQGQCDGAGALLALYADLVVAADDATFRSPFTVLPEASFVTSALTVGMNRAKAWMITDSVLSAAEAETIGFVNEMVPRSELHPAVRRLARRCCKMPLDGIAMSKLIVQSYLDSQGVGEEFDHIPFYAAALEGAS